MKISAIVPTVEGRGRLLKQTINSLTHTTTGYDVELLVVKDAPTIGEAWNEGAEEATGDYLWLGADDVTLADGWLEAVLEASETGIYPTPRLLNVDGSVLACGTLGQGGLIEVEVESGFPCAASQFPFLSRGSWERVGPSLPIGYYADDYLGFRARAAGLAVRLVRDYTLTHYEGTVGRARQVARSMEDRQTFLSTIAKEHECLAVPS